MKRLTLILNLFCVFCYAQDSVTIKPKEFRRILLGVTFSPDYCFRDLKNKDGSDMSQFIMQSDNQIDAPKFGFTSGFAFCYNFTKRFGIETGIQYSNKGFRTKDGALTFGDLIDRRRGFIYNSSALPKNGKFVYTYNYIDMPFKVNFLVGKKKFRFLYSIGLIANIFLTETNSFIGKDASGNSFHSISTNNSYNRLNLSPIISTGVDWKISNKTTLRIEPTFRYGVVPVINAPITGYLWSGGLNISYYFGL